MKFKILIIPFLFLTNISFSQDFNYKWIESTGEITSFEELVIEFSYTYTYDTDFHQQDENTHTKFQLLVEKKDRNINGRFLTLWNGKKVSLEILSCFAKNYNNSSDKFYLFKCENQTGKIIYFILENKVSGWFLSMEIDNAKRLYFAQSAVD